MTRTLARLLAGVAALVLVCGLTACSSEDGESPPRSVTTEESQALASMRFRNFDAGTRRVSFDLADGGAATHFDGWYDFVAHIGYGLLAQPDDGALIAWTPTSIGVHEGAAGEAPLPPPPAAEWASGSLDPGGVRLHALLSVISALGADRPDNPLLLQQSGALWLADEEIGGEPVTVFAGPASDTPIEPGQTADAEAANTRYWVDAGGLLLRADVRLGDDADWTTLTFGPGESLSLRGALEATAR